jgi:3-oxoadipate enol-lactonase
MLSFKERGKGLPLVLLHAFPLSSEMWKMELERFSVRSHVLAPDLPGFGTSPGTQPLTMESMARDVAALLDAHKIKEPVVIGGLSMGGYVAFEFLRLFPSRVRGMILMATRATPDSPEAREKRLKSIEAIDRYGLGPFGKKTIKNLLGDTTRAKNPAVTDFVRTARHGGPARQFAAFGFHRIPGPSPGRRGRRLGHAPGCPRDA